MFLVLQMGQENLGSTVFKNNCSLYLASFCPKLHVASLSSMYPVNILPIQSSQAVTLSYYPTTITSIKHCRLSHMWLLIPVLIVPTRIWGLWKLGTLFVLFTVTSSELESEDSYNWHLINICWSKKWLMIMHLFLLIVSEVLELRIMVYLVLTHWFLEVHKGLTVLNWINLEVYIEKHICWLIWKSSWKLE